MSNIRLSPQTTLQVVFGAVVQVLKQPAYSALALVSMFLISGLIIWSLNLDLVAYIIGESSMSFIDKVRFFSYTYEALFTTYDSLYSLGILVFSVLFGINIAMITYVIKRQGAKAIPKKSGSFAAVMAVIGGGCVACGTSLLTPLLSSIGATSSAFASDLGSTLIWLSSALTTYSIYRLSRLIRIVKTGKL